MIIVIPDSAVSGITIINGICKYKIGLSLYLYVLRVELQFSAIR